MNAIHQSLFFESWSDDPFRVMVEPEAFDWDLVPGDRFEVRWPAGDHPEQPTIVWHGRNCVAVFPPTEYEVFLNGQEAIALLRLHNPPPWPPPNNALQRTEAGDGVGFEFGA